MNVNVFGSKAGMDSAAAELGSNRIREAFAANGSASIIVATGASQFDMLESLRERDLA